MKGAVFSLLLFPVLVFSYVSPGNPTGYVNDFANALSTQEVGVLESKVQEHKQNTSHEIAVVTINSLDGDSIENYAVKLFEEWGIGKEEEDNGVLLLVAVDDRKVRIEVGYGLEGVVTDAEANRVIQNIIVPSFKNQEYFIGINGAVDHLMALSAGEVLPQDEKIPTGVFVGMIVFFFVWGGGILFSIFATFSRSKTWYAGGIVGFALSFLLFYILDYSLTSRLWIAGGAGILGLIADYIASKYFYGKLGSYGRGGHWYSGGGSGGSSGGFGGGSSGGGGASGSW